MRILSRSWCTFTWDCCCSKSVGGSLGVLQVVWEVNAWAAARAMVAQMHRASFLQEPELEVKLVTVRWVYVIEDQFAEGLFTWWFH